MAHRAATTPTAAGLALAAAPGLSACGDSAGEDVGVTVADLREGTAEVAEDEVVTVSANITEVFSQSAFTIAGEGDGGGEPLLVISPDDVVGVTPELAAAVTGTVQEDFDVLAVEEEEGLDLDDEQLADWAGQSYVLAEEVDLFQTDENQ